MIDGQLYGAASLAAVAAGPRPIPKGRLFVQALAEAIRDAGQLPVLPLHTQVLAAGLAREDGVSSVIDTLVRF